MASTRFQKYVRTPRSLNGLSMKQIQSDNSNVIHADFSRKAVAGRIAA